MSPARAQPGPLDLEKSALTMRPPCLPPLDAKEWQLFGLSVTYKVEGVSWDKAKNKNKIHSSMADRIHLFSVVPEVEKSSL